MPPPPWHPNSPVTPWGAPHPAPSARKSVIRLHRKLPSAPLRAPRRFRNPKIGQQLGAQPTPGVRAILLAEIAVKIDVMIDVEIDAVIDPLPPFSFCRPQAMRTFWLRWTPGYAG